MRSLLQVRSVACHGTHDTELVDHYRGCDHMSGMFDDGKTRQNAKHLQMILPGVIFIQDHGMMNVSHVDLGRVSTYFVLPILERLSATVTLPGMQVLDSMS